MFLASPLDSRWSSSTSESTSDSQPRSFNRTESSIYPASSVAAEVVEGDRRQERFKTQTERSRILGSSIWSLDQQTYQTSCTAEEFPPLRHGGQVSPGLQSGDHNSQASGNAERTSDGDHEQALLKGMVKSESEADGVGYYRNNVPGNKEWVGSPGIGSSFVPYISPQHSPTLDAGKMDSATRRSASANFADFEPKGYSRHFPKGAQSLPTLADSPSERNRSDFRCFWDRDSQNTQTPKSQMPSHDQMSRLLLDHSAENGPLKHNGITKSTDHRAHRASPATRLHASATRETIGLPTERPLTTRSKLQPSKANKSNNRDITGGRRAGSSPRAESATPPPELSAGPYSHVYQAAALRAAAQLVSTSNHSSDGFFSQHDHNTSYLQAVADSLSGIAAGSSSGCEMIDGLGSGALSPLESGSGQLQWDIPGRAGWQEYSENNKTNDYVESTFSITSCADPMRFSLFGDEGNSQSNGQEDSGFLSQFQSQIHHDASDSEGQSECVENQEQSYPNELESAGVTCPNQTSAADSQGYSADLDPFEEQAGSADNYGDRNSPRKPVAAPPTVAHALSPQGGSPSSSATTSASHSPCLAPAMPPLSNYSLVDDRSMGRVMMDDTVSNNSKSRFSMMYNLDEFRCKLDSRDNPAICPLGSHPKDSDFQSENQATYSGGGHDPPLFPPIGFEPCTNGASGGSNFSGGSFQAGEPQGAVPISLSRPYFHGRMLSDEESQLLGNCSGNPAYMRPLNDPCLMEPHLAGLISRSDGTRSGSLASRMSPMEIDPIKIPLGEKGRGELKTAIRVAIKSNPSFREKANEIAKLKCATIPQLLKIASICGLWPLAVDISQRFLNSKMPKQFVDMDHNSDLSFSSSSPTTSNCSGGWSMVGKRKVTSSGIDSSPEGINHPSGTLRSGDMLEAIDESDLPAGNSPSKKRRLDSDAPGTFDMQSLSDIGGFSANEFHSPSSSSSHSPFSLKAESENTPNNNETNGQFDISQLRLPVGSNSPFQFPQSQSPMEIRNLDSSHGSPIKVEETQPLQQRHCQRKSAPRRSRKTHNMIGTYVDESLLMSESCTVRVSDEVRRRFGICLPSPKP